jgi:hypothetical protein
MRVSMAAVALGVGLALAPAVQAQDFDRDFDQLRADRSEDNGLSLRWSTSLGARRADEAGPRLALRLSRDVGGGQMQNLDIVSYSLAAHDRQRLSAPFAFNATGDGHGFGGWVSSHKILVGASAALLIWGIIELANDDDHHSNSGACTTTC